MPILSLHPKIIWACLWMTECYYHVMYVIQSESTLYSCLNVKELLAQNRCDIWSLSDSNGIRTHNHLVRKRTLNHLLKQANLAKWLNILWRTKWLWLWIPLMLMNVWFVGWDAQTLAGAIRLKMDIRTLIAL